MRQFFRELELFCFVDIIDKMGSENKICNNLSLNFGI